MQSKDVVYTSNTSDNEASSSNMPCSSSGGKMEGKDKQNFPEYTPNTNIEEYEFSDDPIQSYATQLLSALCSSSDPVHYLNKLQSETLDPRCMSVLNATLSYLLQYERREKLPQYNTVNDFVSLIENSQNIMVVNGAGISVSCGIPDFRSKNGLYSTLQTEFPELESPTDMFSLPKFKENPKPFYKFAKAIYPGLFTPSFSHTFIKKLQDAGKLLRMYTQNIDTLENIAGIKNVVQCHGSFSTASCLACKAMYHQEDIRDEIMNQKVAYCRKCTLVGNVIKPNIVFFGEGLPESFYSHIKQDSEKCDLLIVIGTSMKVSPVAQIPHRIKTNVPTILINNETVEGIKFDIQLLGDCDGVLKKIDKMVKWNKMENLQSNTNGSNEPCLVNGMVNISKSIIDIETYLQMRGYTIDDNSEMFLLKTNCTTKFEESDWSTSDSEITKCKLKKTFSIISFMGDENDAILNNHIVQLKPHKYLFGGCRVKYRIKLKT